MFEYHVYYRLDTSEFFETGDTYIKCESPYLIDALEQALTELSDSVTIIGISRVM